MKYGDLAATRVRKLPPCRLHPDGSYASAWFSMVRTEASTSSPSPPRSTVPASNSHSSHSLLIANRHVVSSTMDHRFEGLAQPTRSCDVSTRPVQCIAVEYRLRRRLGGRSRIFVFSHPGGRITVCLSGIPRFVTLQQVRTDATNSLGPSASATPPGGRAHCSARPMGGGRPPGG